MGSYALNGPKSNFLHRKLEIMRSEFDWVILANQVQVRRSGIPINLSSR